MADLSVYDKISRIKPIEINIPQIPTPFQQFEDMEKVKGVVQKNKLQNIIKGHYASGQDYKALYKQLAAEGFGDEIPAFQKQQMELEKSTLEQEKAKYENALRKSDYVARNVSPFLDMEASPETQAKWSANLAQMNKETGTTLDLPEQFDPGLIRQKHQQGLTAVQQYANKYREIDIKMDKYKQDYAEKRDDRQFAMQQQRQDRQDQNARWYQAPGADGLPVWKQGKQEGAPVYSPTGISNKPLPIGQAKQVVGVKNLSDSIDEYTKQLDNFSLTDLANPDKHAAMGTKYNNMMLQAKEAYNLGVLNGPDYEILTSVITDPRSMKGVITSNKALKLQATELKRIMGKIGTNAGAVQIPGQDLTQQTRQTTQPKWNTEDEQDPMFQDYLRETGGQ
ncbi:MAG: hypothetical protein WC465_04860 [Patescibacteria group bacterium]